MSKNNRCSAYHTTQIKEKLSSHENVIYNVNLRKPALNLTKSSLTNKLFKFVPK